MNIPHEILGHLLLDLNLVFQSRLTKSAIHKDLERLPEVEVVFVEADVLLRLFLSLDLHVEREVLKLITQSKLLRRKKIIHLDSDHPYHILVQYILKTLRVIGTAWRLVY